MNEEHIAPNSFILLISSTNSYYMRLYTYVLKIRVGTAIALLYKIM